VFSNVVFKKSPQFYATRLTLQIIIINIADFSVVEIIMMSCKGIEEGIDSQLRVIDFY